MCVLACVRACVAMLGLLGGWVWERGVVKRRGRGVRFSLCVCVRHSWGEEGSKNLNL